MKKAHILIYIIILISSKVAIAQNYTFYSICESSQIDNFSYEWIEMKPFTKDLIVFDKREFKRQEGYDYYHHTVRISSYEEQVYLMKIDDSSFLLYWVRGGSYIYYHLKKKTILENENVSSKRCKKALEILASNLPQIKKCEAERVARVEAELEAKKAEYKAKQEAESLKLKEEKAKEEVEFTRIRTEIMKVYQSKKNDPVLEKAIINWWNNDSPDFPAIKVYFISNTFSNIRDGYNQILRKTIPALLTYKGKNGTCWVRLYEFGYEHLGAGNFENELKGFDSKYYTTISNSAGSFQIHCGKDQAIKCDGVK